MHVRATVIASWALGLLVAQSTAGCAVELVRPIIDPPAVAARAVDPQVDGGVVYLVGDPTPSTDQALATALRDARVFRGGVVPDGSPEASSARCEARLVATRVSDPVVWSKYPRELLHPLTLCTAGLAGPLYAIWTDREPDLVASYVLEVNVRGEATAARYEVTARGTIRAQSPDPRAARDGLEAARAALRDLALESLVSRFADDHAAHERLRALLSDAPATELEPLLVTKETYAPRARWRTRRLVGWKSESLEGHVAELKTSELRTLVGRLEACMLDLTHEASAAKDEAGRKVAAGADDRNERDLSLAYVERVEVLRPILTAAKEELDGRAR